VQKALVCREDPVSAFIWLLEVVKRLAVLETTIHKETIQREVVQQALRLNPTAFETLFSDLIDGPKDLLTIEKQLSLTEAYLIDKAAFIFNPLLTFLDDLGESVGAEDISRHFDNRLLLDSGDYRLIGACEWLVELGLLGKLVSAVKLTSRSRVTLDEPAYFVKGA
jgi:hypothetical protein